MRRSHREPQSPAGTRDTPSAAGPDRGSRYPALRRRGWLWATLKRTVSEYQRHGLADWAAALTYYAVLSIFPALLALVSIVGVLGSSAVDELIANLSALTPGPVRSLLTEGLEQVRDGQGKAGVVLALGILLALWSASGYVAGFMRAANAVYEVGEGRSAWRTLPIRLSLTLLLMLLMAMSAVAVVFTGNLADETGRVLGIGDTVVWIWDLAKWPVLALLISFLVALLYWAAPSVRRPFRWISPGSVLAVLIWILTSLAFAFYVANFGSYNKTYGSLSAAIVFLVWLWISNIAILLGLEFNTDLERTAASERDAEPDADSEQ